MGLLKPAESPKIWFEVIDLEPFEIEVQYLSPEDMRRLTTASTRNVLDKNTRAVVPQVDSEGLSKLMVKSMVKGWRGLSVDVLKKLMPLAPDVEEAIEAAGGELKFSPEDLQFLVDNTYASAFMKAIMDLATDMQEFRKAELAIAAKNSVG